MGKNSFDTTQVDQLAAAEIAYCSFCGEQFDADGINTLCPDCREG